METRAEAYFCNHQAHDPFARPQMVHRVADSTTRDQGSLDIAFKLQEMSTHSSHNNLYPLLYLTQSNQICYTCREGCRKFRRRSRTRVSHWHREDMSLLRHFQSGCYADNLPAEGYRRSWSSYSSSAVLPNLRISAFDPGVYGDNWCNTQRNGTIGTHNFAKTPLKAAQAPLATARTIHWDLALMLP